MITIICLAVLFIGGSFGAGYALGDHQKHPVVATVNGQPISKDDLYQALVNQSGKQTLDQLITNKLLDQAAAQQGVKITDKDVQDVIDRITQQIGGDAQLQMALAQYGMTMDQFKEQARTQAILEKLLGPKVTVTDDQINQYFNDNKSQFDQPAQVQLAHIVVNSQTDADNALNQLKGGAKFSDVADKVSVDPGVKDDHGEMGWVSQGSGQLTTDVEKVVFATEKGKYTQAIKTDVGYEIFYVEDTKPAVSATLDDATKAKIKQTLIDQGIQDQATDFINNLKAKAKITDTLDPTENSNGNG